MSPTKRLSGLRLPTRPTGTAASLSVGISVVMLTGMLTGCASNLSGVGGTEAFACQAPIGAQCTSISGVFANASANANANANARARANANSPADLQIRTAEDAHRPQAAAPGRATTPPGPPSVIAATAMADATQSGRPAPAQAPAADLLRSPPRVVKLWIAPWEDADGDLHEASFVHVVIDTGRWLIERVRPAPRLRMDGVRPPAAPAAQSAPSPSATRVPSTPSAGSADLTPSSDPSPIEP